MADKRSCPVCGNDLPANAPKGLCPQCLMKAGMQVSHRDIHANHPSTRSNPTADKQPGGFTPPTPKALADWFPQLDIVELLGQGGMGAVYKARQRQLDRWVALKILPPEVGRDPAFAERFSREARSLARLNHPNIVTIYDFGHADQGLYYLMMEYVEGTDLRRVILGKDLTSRQALAIVPQICEALQYAHEQGVVHRDIKPENILLDKTGRVKIADFGLARLVDAAHNPLTLTQAGQRMGTPHYMAPEQIEHPHDVDHRADIYSLGVVFYEMLTGELPIGRFSPPSKKVQVDVRLDEIVLHTLEKEPELRYQQASEIKTDVERVCNTGPRPDVTSRDGPEVRSSSEYTRARRVLAVMGALTLTSGILMLLLLIGTLCVIDGFGNPLQNDGVRIPLMVLQIIAIPAGILMLIGGLSRGARGTTWLRAGAILGLLPLTPAWPVVLPLGIWVLATLSNQEVRDAFASRDRSSQGNTRVSGGTWDQRRFSRAAIVGVCVAPLASLLVMPPVFQTLVYVFRFHQSLRNTISAGTVMLVILGLIGFVVPFATTILGVTAIANIRSSAGRIYGMGLALFDGLLFPLMALDAVILLVLALLAALFQIPKVVPLSLMSIGAILVVPVSVVVDVMVVRWIWRKLNNGVRGSGFDHRPVPRIAEPLAPYVSRKAIVGAACIPLFVFFLIMLSTHEGYKRFESLFIPKSLYLGEWFFTLVVTMAGVAAPCVTTVLGSMALIEIRRSPGRIMGLGMALADVLLLPLLAMDFGLVVIFCANQSPLQQYSAVTFPLALLIGAVLDVLIVRWAWRKAKTGLTHAVRPSEPEPPASSVLI